MKVAVIGAGVIGMTSALAIKGAFPESDVTVFSSEFSPNTTGDGSAGLWGPYCLGQDSPSSIILWAGKTHEWLARLWKSGLSRETGVSLLPVVRVCSTIDDDHPRPFWSHLVYGAKQLTPEQLAVLNAEHKSSYRVGWHFLTFTSEPVMLLPWLMNQFVERGGKVVQRKIDDIKELTKEMHYQVVVNCTGIGARQLVNDISLVPIRGQVTRVDASWAFQCHINEDDDGNYIIPNVDTVVLGGTHQEDDFDCNVRPSDSDFIHNGCYKIMPGLKESKILKQWVGLRPGRPRVRLEAEERNSQGDDVLIIHNYGHGGSGVTLCWGCALSVVDIMRANIIKSIVPSKL